MTTRDSSMEGADVDRFGTGTTDATGQASSEPVDPPPVCC